jgi:G3E family GTPase
MTDPVPEGLPVSILTGFLGSGKTTLLSRLLRHPAMGRTALVINEFGEVGIDGALVEAAEEETVVLDSGCVCCTVRGDLVDSLNRLYERRRAGAIPEFDRVLVETTGLADPAPILHTLMNDTDLAARYRLDGVIATVDAVMGASQLERHKESVKQAAVADRLVLTKTDIAAPEAVAALKAQLGAINPAAMPIVAVFGEADPDALFGAGLYDPRTKTADVRRWLNEEAYDAERRAHAHDGHAHHDHVHDGHACGPDCEHDHHGTAGPDARHASGIRSFCLKADKPLRWADVDEAFGLLLQMHGDRVLRVKGLLDVAEVEQPVVIHGVQHLFHPPSTLEAWPDADRCSRIVFITQDLDETRVRQVLGPFLPIG